MGSPESFAIERPMMRWFAILYCEPAFSVSAPPKPPSDSGLPAMYSVASLNTHGCWYDT